MTWSTCLHRGNGYKSNAKCYNVVLGNQNKNFYPHEIGQVDTVLKGKKDKLNDYDQKCHVQAPGIGLNK